MTPTTRQLWWLTVYDPETGIATRVVGAVGAQNGDRYLSWMPLDDRAARWATTPNVFSRDIEDMMSVDIDAAASVADGIVLGFVPIEDPPTSPDLAGAVETVIDRALTAAAEHVRV